MASFSGSEIINIHNVKDKISRFTSQLTIQLAHNREKKDELQKEKDFLEKIQTGYLNAILDKIAKELRKDE